MRWRRSSSPTFPRRPHGDPRGGARHRTESPGDCDGLWRYAVEGAPPIRTVQGRATLMLPCIDAPCPACQFRGRAGWRQLHLRESYGVSHATSAMAHRLVELGRRNDHRLHNVRRDFSEEQAARRVRRAEDLGGLSEWLHGGKRSPLCLRYPLRSASFLSVTFPDLPSAFHCSGRHISQGVLPSSGRRCSKYVASSPSMSGQDGR
jgi:hypothetical protein